MRNAFEEGTQKYKEGNHGAAIKYFTEALQLNPENDATWVFRGASKQVLYRFKEAAEDFTQATQLNPQNAHAWRGRGYCCLMLGDSEESLQAYDEAIKIDPQNEAAWRCRGHSKRMLSRFDESLADYAKAIELNPNKDSNWQGQGDSRRMLGFFDESLVDYAKAIELNPKNDSAWRGQADSKRMLGRIKEALDDYTKAIELNPKNAAARRGRAECKRIQRNYKESIKDYDEAIRLDPEHDESWRCRGDSKRMQDLFEEAIKDCSNALRLNPQNDSAWRCQGDCKRMLARNEEAITCYDEAIRLNPKNHYAWRGRGISKILLRHYDGAILDYETALKLDPVNSELKAELEKLKEQVTNWDPMAIPKSELKLESFIGEGRYGEVHLGWWKKKNEATSVAIKRLKHQVLSDVLIRDFKQEVKVYSELASPYVVKLHGVTAEQPYCLIMEWMSKGSLRDLLDVNSHKQLSWGFRLSIARNIASGLLYLHTQKPGIFHSNLESKNILLNEKLEAKLTNFGFSQLKTEIATQSNLASFKIRKVKTSLLWMAPELFQIGGIRKAAADMYSFAIILWELASHLYPYENAMGNLRMIENSVASGERETFGDRTPNIPANYQALIEQCWSQIPSDRPTAQEALDRLKDPTEETPIESPASKKGKYF